MSKLLVAVSDRWVPDERCDAIAHYAQRLGASLFLLHVVYGADADASAPGERVLEQIAARIKSCNVPVETLLLFADDFAAALLKTAEERKCSMIVLGMSAKALLTRLIEGNVSQEIIKASKLPLLLLPPDWKGEL